MNTIQHVLALAIEHHQAGRLHDAESMYRQILEVDSGHADAWHLVGVVACQNGEHSAGVECIQRALVHRPQWAEAHYNLAKAWEEQGKLDDAVICYRRALELQPDYADAGYNLAGVFQLQGKLEDAALCYWQVVQTQPNHAPAHYKLGVIWQAQGKLDEAAAAYQQALALNPGSIEALNDLGNVYKLLGRLAEAENCYLWTLQQSPGCATAYCNLGVVYQELGKLDQAVACCRQAIHLQPDHATAHYNLATLLKDQGKLDEAVAAYHRTLRLQPEYALAHYNLAIVYQSLGKHDEAIACFRQELQRQPDLPEAHNNLGNVYHEVGRLDEARRCYQHALELQPDFALAQNNLGNLLKDQGNVDEALAFYERALKRQPEFAALHSNLLLIHQYRPGVTLAELASAHAQYDRLHAQPLRTAWPLHHVDGDPDRPLRLGFISADLGRHPVGAFLIRVLENLDPDQCETVCYSDRLLRDELTERFQSAATTWRQVNGLSDQALTKQIVQDRIDILFDLAGHTAHNRLLVFARKPAPIQVTWAGYMGTTGLETMDYILADRHQIPPGAEVHYCEQVLRMPDGYVTYDPPGYAPPVAPLPALEQGHVVFGSFNNRAKIDSRTVALWTSILSRVPDARLVLKFKGMSDRSSAKGLIAEFARHGVEAARLELLDQSPHADLLAEYRRIDLGLDPLPYNGGLTTCEALWMGVPVLTCPGETFASRHSLSHLSTVGLKETIANTPEEYVELAVALAHDLPRLAAWRAGLRERMAASPLCDGRRFAKNLMHLLRGTWQAWCRREQVEIARAMGSF